MAVRTEKIAVVLEFLNEESKSLGRHVKEAQNLNKEIAALAIEEKKLANEAAKATAAGKDTTAIEAKRVLVQEQLNEKMLAVLRTGKGIEKLDLGKVAPTQLVSIAKELERMVGPSGFIPKGTAQFTEMSAALKKVNDQLAVNRAETKGVAKGMQEASVASKAFEVAFGVGLADLVENLVGKIKEIGVELYKRSTELEGFSRKTKLVFGDATKDIEAFAERMSVQVGQSTADVIGDLNDISNSFTTLEFGKKDVAGLTKQLYELSAQWAQYNGGKYTALEISEKFKVALGGEVDELAEMGIVLTQDTLLKEMSKKGYDKLTGASFDQASALTLLQIITKKTAEAQASFGTNAETMAAKQNRVTTWLKNMWDDAARNLTGFFSKLTGSFAGIADYFSKPAKTIVESTKEMQYAFNSDIEVITKANITTAQRAELIKKLNGEYKQYLPNLVSETASNEELNRVRDAGNKLFEKHIFYLAYKMKLDEINAKLTGATKGILEAEMKETTAKFDQAQRKFGDDGDKMYKNQMAIANVSRAAAKLMLTEGQKELEMFNAAAESTAKGMKTTFAELNKMFGETDKNYAAGVQFKKELDPEEAKKQAEAAFKAKLEAAKAGMELELVLNEKNRLENKISEEKYQQEYHDIKKRWLEKEAEIYKDSIHAKSLDAAKVQKDLVELEKNTAATLLKLKLEDVDRETLALKAVAENRFLLDTEGDKLSKDEFEARQRAFKIREIDIDVKAAQQKLDLLKAAHQEESTQYVTLQNTILKLQQNRRDVERGQIDKDNKDASDARKRAIDEAVEAEETEFERKSGALRVKFVRLLITEQDYEMQRLQLKKAAIEAEIALLQEGDEKQRKHALKLGGDLAAIDADIEAQKIKNKQRSADIEQELLQKKVKMGHDALSIAIDLLSKDEASRKKHADAIKAFEIGQVWLNTYAEISAIWSSNRKNPLYAAVPGLAQGISIVESALSIGRAVSNTQKITATKFAEGGFTESIGAPRDETGHEPVGIVHEGEWVAPKWMVRQYRGIFNNLDNVRLGQIMNGQRTLLPRFADGGAVSFNLTPRSDLVVPPQYNVANYGQNTSVDVSSLAKELQLMRTDISTWQQSFEVKMYYTSFKKSVDTVEADLVAGSL